MKSRTIKAQYNKTALANMLTASHYPVSGVAERLSASEHYRTGQSGRLSTVNSTEFTLSEVKACR